MRKEYRIREFQEDYINATALADIPSNTRKLLYSRGITNEKEAREFLSPDFARDSHDPFLLPDIHIATERIVRAVETGENISVWSDYDCDGIPGGVMLTDILRTLGAKVTHYIPHRHDEGYGLNIEGINELAASGNTLIITVDLGSTDTEPAARAKELNIDLIITDHHTIPEVLPEALAIINPHRADSKYPFTDLCGAGVAWKLAQALLTILRKRQIEDPDKICALSEGQEKWLLDLVGMATIADMVPLLGENRALAQYGLLVMRKNRRPGLRSLLSLAKINADRITEDDIGFMIAPRINAASRMDSPHLAARLLAEKDLGKSEDTARELQRLNDERKGTVAAIVKEARHRLREQSENSTTKPSVLVMGSPDWRPGVLGLVANKLMETEHVPVFLWGRHGETSLKGSCRSDGSVHVVEMMRAAAHVFEGFGGHEIAGGFSLLEERAHELAPTLEAAYASTRREPKDEVIFIDLELSVEEADKTLKEIAPLAPFGVGNPKPLLAFRNVTISKIKTFGKHSEHLELIISSTNSFRQLSAIAFFSTPETFQNTPRENIQCDVVGHIETGWNGRARLRIVDIL